MLKFILKDVAENVGFYALAVGALVCFSAGAVPVGCAALALAVAGLFW